MSKAKRNGGYVLVDFSGVKVDQSLVDMNQTPDNPVFETVRLAIKHNKPVLLSNVVIVASDEAKFVMTPIPVSFLAMADIDGDPLDMTLVASTVVAGNVFSFNITTDGDDVDYVTLTQ